MISPPTCVATDNARALLPVAVGPTTASSSGRPSVVCIDLSRLLKVALRLLILLPALSGACVALPKGERVGVRVRDNGYRIVDHHHLIRFGRMSGKCPRHPGSPGGRS